MNKLRGHWVLALGVWPLLALARPILPEHTTTVTLSNRDVNRLVCQYGSVSDVNFSAEKGMEVKMEGQNLFVKFQWHSDGLKADYRTEPAELFVTCAGDVYALVIRPEAVRARTLYLGNPVRQRITDNLALYAPLKLEEQIIDLTLRAMQDDLPESFTVQVTESRRWQDHWVRGLKLAPVRTVIPEGIGLKLTEYRAASLYDRRTQLRETDFLVKALGQQILGVTVNPLTLVAGGISRVYIVERVQP